MTERAKELLSLALADLKAKLEAEGVVLDGIGLSLFMIGGGETNWTDQHSCFAGDLATIGMFAPDWPFLLTADLLDEPTEALTRESGGEGGVH